MYALTLVSPKSSVSLVFSVASSSLHSLNSFASLRFSNPASLSNIEVQEVLAAKSAKVAALLEKKNSKDEISTFLRNIPAKPETFELVVKFCYGFELQITSDNVVPLACLACYLEMSESRSKNNLLGRVIAFFQHTVLPNWKETIKALRCITEHLHQSKEIGLFDACLESIVEKVHQDPRLLGEPTKRNDGGNDGGCDDNNNNTWPNARRKLFVLDCEQEDLTTLPVQIYEPIVHVMNLRGIAPEYVSASVCKYTEKWVFSCFIASGGDQKMSAYKRNSIREIIEAIERLLPNEKGLIPCSLLFDLLRFSILLGASLDCVSGFETRIGKQLEQASLNDLFIPCQCINVECLKRILKSFYRNFNGSDPSGFLKVAELVEEYLGEVASSDVDLGIDEFISLAELSVAASLGSQRGSDGIYRAIDLYLEKHNNLTEAEKEQVCQVMDCQKMSQEALQHAAQNSRLPLRTVVQILFVGQLHLRDKIASEAQEKTEQKVIEDHQEDEEMQLINMKVSELERESLLMKKEIEKCHRKNNVTKKESVSVWTKMKRKFGCISNNSTHEGYYRMNKKKLPPQNDVRHEERCRFV
ncbi:BTB/POZ domain-containing protein At5g17580-like [Prosopis cineraria]|uniref:BTB/POZ domain-containing protein At5g17580-like n=1 Tax=Prosopis cineraria TaxID=364024 RepID=UPI00240EED91|nr:BTB/POZ domain-containing protein At5g17580-like [Prosopis cineraria]